MRILFFCAPSDKPYLPRIKKYVGSANVYLSFSFSMLTELVIKAKEHKADWVCTTRKDILDALCKAEGYDSREDISLYDYVGSVFVYKGINILILPPLITLVASSTGPFIFERMMNKITKPAAWFEPTEFAFLLAGPENYEILYEQLTKAWAIAVDIETIPEDKVIKEVGYTGIFWNEDKKRFETLTFVVELKTDFDLVWIRKFNSLPAPKIGQNFKYDLAYLLRYDALPDNYLSDTITLFHCYYCELPKDLVFQSSFFIKIFKYWNHEAASANAYTRLQYNA